MLACGDLKKVSMSFKTCNGGGNIEKGKHVGKVRQLIVQGISKSSTSLKVCKDATTLLTHVAAITR